MEIPHAPRMLPLICYEAIFPGDVVERNDRPGWIVNLTNDGWFGISTGPYQHLQQARLRAIEQGLPLVRAANTGISAVIDPLGRMVARLDLGLEGVLDSGLPSAIPPTIYARVGDIPAAIIVSRSVNLRGPASRREASFLTCRSRLVLNVGRKAACGNPPVDRPTAPFAFWRADHSRIDPSVPCSNCLHCFSPTLRAGFDGSAPEASSISSCLIPPA